MQKSMDCNIMLMSMHRIGAAFFCFKIALHQDPDVERKIRKGKSLLALHACLARGDFNGLWNRSVLSFLSAISRENPFGGIYSHRGFYPN